MKSVCGQCGKEVHAALRGELRRKKLVHDLTRHLWTVIVRLAKGQPL